MQIELSQISKRFGYQWIIRDLDLTLESGSITGIKGLNGSGKSTLIKILSGFLSPSIGKITYSLARKPIAISEIYKHLSWVAPYISLTENYTIEEVYNLQSKFKSMKTTSFKEFLDIIELSKHQNKYIKDFSSGMQQRLQLGIAILSQTTLLLLDEPTSYLDTNAVIWYHNLLNKYRSHRTIVIASNDKNDLIECQEHIVIDAN